MESEIVAKIREFNRFYTNIIGLLNNHILESNYSLTEVRTMYEIYHNPNIRARQIKETLQVDEGYLSRLLSKLVKQKIIIKEKSENDSRIYSLTLTEKGKEIFLQLNQRSSDTISKMIQHLDKKEQEELIQHIKKLQYLLSTK
jgi:DNA-binding MarR family transcriptional regulator